MALPGRTGRSLGLDEEDPMAELVERAFRGHEGLRLVAHCFGDDTAPPVLLLHGGGQTRHSWDATGSALADRGFYAVALDLRGHGDSDWHPQGDYSILAYCDDVVALCGQFDRPALVGASLGGIASILAVGEHAVAASALVLVDIATKMDPQGVEKIMGFMRAFPEGFASLDDAADAIATYMPHRPRPADTSGLRKNLRQGPDGRWRWHWDPNFMSVDRRPVSQEYPDRLDDAARNIDIPCLLVRGKLSELIDEQAVAHFLSIVPHAEYTDVAGAGHMVAGDRNDVFSAAVIDFLTRTRAAANG